MEGLQHLNLLFLTQSNGLRVFYDLAGYLKTEGVVRKAGFYLADLAFFEKFKQTAPDLESFELLKEWDILRKASSVAPDLSLLRQYEKELGDPTLWNALVADRRIYLGPRACVEEDERQRYTHQQMLSILQTGLAEIEGLFDRLKPDAVVGFICVTIGEYLSYLVAKKRGIPFLNLRPTRIQNFFHAGESILEPSSWLEETYRRLLKSGLEEKTQTTVKSFLAEVRTSHAMYEGVIPAARNPAVAANQPPLQPYDGIAAKLKGLFSRTYRHHFTKDRFDNHYQGTLYPYFFKYVKRPLRLRTMEKKLVRHYLREEALSGIDYAFYPLHKEPEVTLLVYGRPFLNQLEIVRLIARSLPIGMTLVVKEHPAAVGYRPASYYEKLLKIPNVALVRPNLPSRRLVEKCRLVTVIGGSVALEALMMKKPAVALGHVPFECLPPHMFRSVRDLERLAWEIRDLLAEFRPDEEALSAYVAAVMQTSVPVDFYSVLLGRDNVYRSGDGQQNKAETYRNHLNRLGNYLAARFKEDPNLGIAI